jgi:uncharacterized membrane protein
VSFDGTVVVGCSDERPFRWTDESNMRELDVPESTVQACADAISGDGTTAVGTYRVQLMILGSARRWVGESPGSNVFFAQGAALATNADGSVVVGWESGATIEFPPQFAAIWDPEHQARRFQDLLPAARISGWQLQRATGVSADGKVVAGLGVGPDGATQAWLARFP